MASFEDFFARKYEELAERGEMARGLDHLPEGWLYLDGASTAPLGHRWACNGESRFGGEYRHALIKEDE